MTALQHEKAPEPLEGTNALKSSHVGDEIATAETPLTNDDCRRLGRALDPLESERLAREWWAASAEAQSEVLLTSVSIGDRHREWKAAHPSFDPLFEAIRTDADGRTAR